MPKEKWFINASEMDDNQYAIKDLNPDKSFIVQGCAGSGKTILALWRAKELQESGKKIWVIVYTKALRQFIDDGVREIGIDTKRVVYKWWWDNRIAAENKSADYFILDEAQDFTSSEVKDMGDHANVSTMYFGDTAQQLYPKKKVKGADGKEVEENTLTVKDIAIQTLLSIRELSKNYRLPQTVARLAQCVPLVFDDLEARCKKVGGKKPVVRKSKSVQAELDFIINRIKVQNLTDVGILVPHNQDAQKVYLYMKEKGLNPEVKYQMYDENGNELGKEINLDFGTDNPKIMTYHSSKGLQFETVFIPMCETSDNNFRNPLYVALTRTYKDLYITYVKDLSPFISKTASPTLYDHETEK